MAAVRRFLTRAHISLLVASLVFLLSLLGIRDPLTARVVGLSGAALVLWLWEAMPGFVPTLLLWAGIPLLLAEFGTQYRLAHVLSWAADPVLALFLGAFILARAAQSCGLDQNFTHMLLRAAGASRPRLLAAICFGTAFLSMWMSNVAAAALMLATLRPLFAGQEAGERRLLLLSLVLGANVGGMISPLASGPNAIALAQLESMGQHVGFVTWILIALPLATLLMVLGLLGLHVAGRRRSTLIVPQLGLAVPEAPGQRNLVLLMLGLSILAWLTESWHGIPAAVTALSAAALLFLLGVLKKADLAHIDGSSLLLIAGGITLGRLLESTGLFEAATSSGLWLHLSPSLRYSLLLGSAALLSALMSNTATATLLLPMAAHISPGAEAPILIAIACSLGMPFVISTPPNAMVAGEGGITNRDLMLLGLPLMIVGLIWIVLTGPKFLQQVLGS